MIRIKSQVTLYSLFSLILI